MNEEWIFVIGAIVGFFASVIGSYISHLLKLKEQSIGREFEMRRGGKDFYLALYGFVAGLDDLAMSYPHSVKEGKAQVLVRKGFLCLKPNDIIANYKNLYNEFTKFMAKSRMKGYELFIPMDLSTSIKKMWGFAAFLAEEKQWNPDSAKRFDKVAFDVLVRIEEILGLKPISQIPKWLKPKWWYAKTEKWLGYSS